MACWSDGRREAEIRDQRSEVRVAETGAIVVGWSLAASRSRSCMVKTTPQAGTIALLLALVLGPESQSGK